MSLYVYALVDAEPAGALETGLAGEALRAVRCGAVWAVAGEMTAPPRVDAASLQAHDGVVRRLAEAADALLPTRFGTQVADEAALAEALAPRAAALAEALEKVRGCVQMTLRVFGTEAAPSPTLPRSAGEGAPATETRDTDVSGRAEDALSRASARGRVGEGAFGPGTRYLEARRREHERLASLPEIEPLRPALRPYLRAERVERRAAGLLLGSAFHLVPRPSLADYNAVLEATGGELPGGFRLSWSGPWPPYAFSSEVTP
ncbi:MAG TPA: GvpL/GvpF family gas vesicle protein [Thermoanaerobaculia bacterium]|nr:GvpL/GvpF family gas vesicle protein [Thermoanaerobaculia bacterium]